MTQQATKAALVTVLVSGLLPRRLDRLVRVGKHEEWNGSQRTRTDHRVVRAKGSNRRADVIEFDGLEHFVQANHGCQLASTRGERAVTQGEQAVTLGVFDP